MGHWQQLSPNALASDRNGLADCNTLLAYSTLLQTVTPYLLTFSLVHLCLVYLCLVHLCLADAGALCARVLHLFLSVSGEVLAGQV